MRGVVQFGGQFNTGCSGTYDRDADLLNGIGLPGVCAQVVVEQLLMKLLCLFAGVEKQAVLCCTLSAEIVGGAAYSNHQRVVTQLAGRHQLLAVFVEGRRQ